MHYPACDTFLQIKYASNEGISFDLCARPYKKTVHLWLCSTNNDWLERAYWVAIWFDKLKAITTQSRCYRLPCKQYAYSHLQRMQYCITSNVYCGKDSEIEIHARTVYHRVTFTNFKLQLNSQMQVLYCRSNLYN